MGFEGLLVLAAIAYLLLPFYLLASLSSLKKRVNELESGKKTKPAQVAQTESSIQNRVTPAAPAAPNSLDDLFAWLKKDWALKLGAFLILLAFAWLTTYAFMNNWIGPMGRIGMGIIGGLLILLLGEWRQKKSIPQGSVLVTLGAGTILVTVFAARNVYDFFNPGLALAFMGLVVVFVAFSAVRHRALSLAVLGLLMGGAAPLLVDSPEPNFLGLFSYLMVLCAGTLWAVGVSGWRVLNNLALVIVALFSFMHIEMLNIAASATLELSFAFAFALLFLTSNSARVFKNRQVDKWDLLNVLGFGLLLLYWVDNSAPEVWKSLILAASMLVLFAISFLLFKKTQLREIIYVYGGLAFLYLAMATYFEVNDRILFHIMYTVEACAVMTGVYAAVQDTKLMKNLSWILLPSILGGLNTLESGSNWNGILHLESFLQLVLAAAGLGTGVFFYKKKEKVSLVFLITGIIYLGTWTWFASDALIQNESMSVLAALTLYTLAGLTLNILGSLRGNDFMKNTGAALIGLVVLRLLAVDVWEMAMSGKIITFFVIGTLLISTAFINKKLTKQ